MSAEPVPLPAPAVLSPKRPRRKRLPSSALRCNDLLFINEYLANGRNGTQAYRVVHPKASYKCANVEAVRVLAKPSVQAEIASRIEHEAGITRELVEQDLLTARSLAKSAGDPTIIAAVAMDCAKLAGFLVDKREVKDTSDKDVVRDYVNQAMRNPLPANG